MTDRDETGAVVPDQDWLTGWAERLRAATEQALRDVVSTFPFEAGENEVGPPSGDAELDDLRRRMPWTPDPLVRLQRAVGPVSLPDIANGYFPYGAGGLTGVLDHHDGRPDRLGDPHGVDIVVFGGDGGGAQFAVALDDGRVFRLREAAYQGGVYDGPGITVVGRDLREFLELLLDAVETFGDGGRITGL